MKLVGNAPFSMAEILLSLSRPGRGGRVRRFTSRKTSGIVGAFGVGLASAAFTPQVEAAIIQLTASPGTVPLGPFSTGFEHIHLAPGSFSVHQENNTVLGKALSAHFGSFGLAGFRVAPASQAITVNQSFLNFLLIPLSATGTTTIGFKTTNNQVGWLRINFGGTGGPVTYLAAAYNDTQGGGIHAGSFEAVPEPSSLALAALSALALGTRGVRRLREKRKAA